MPASAILNFNLVCSVLGGFVTLFGLVSYLLKEGFYLTEPVVSLSAGVFLSPYGINLIRPLEYAGSQEAIATITLCFTRLVLGIQLVLAGVQLPSKYLRKEWRSLVFLLGPGMVAMWICTSLLVWKLVPGLTFMQGLVVGACVTPTDPVLSNSIVKGKFADKHISRPLQKIIIAESGANDGLGYIFLFLPLYMIKFAKEDGLNYGGAEKAISSWLGETCFYTVILSIVYGAVVGWAAKEALHWAEKRRLVDRESFLLFSIALALFIIGTVGISGADDVLACFIAGNTFTWDDWFRRETEDDSLQPTMDMLLNVAVFMWIGAVCPWNMFRFNDVIPIHRLIVLGILVLLLRRLPIIFALRKKIHQIQDSREALLAGFFGPIGISAIFYLHVSLDFLHDVQVNHPEQEDLGKLAEVTLVTVWFLVISSVIVHGLSIPLANLAIYLPRVFRMVRPLGCERVEPSHFNGRTGRSSHDQERRPLLVERSESICSPV